MDGDIISGLTMRQKGVRAACRESVPALGSDLGADFSGTHEGVTAAGDARGGLAAGDAGHLYLISDPGTVA